jgi:transcriptional regulator with XRE-family HTH domain
MDVRRTIGWNLRALRVERGMSQERLALETGIDRSYVGRVERGSENVTIARLESMAQVLGVPVRRLFDEPTTEAVPASLPSGRKRKNTA